MRIKEILDLLIDLIEKVLFHVRTDGRADGAVVYKIVSQPLVLASHMQQIIPPGQGVGQIDDLHPLQERLCFFSAF